MVDQALSRHLRLILYVLLGTCVLAMLLGWFGQSDGGALFVIVALISLIVVPVSGLLLLAIFAILARDGWRIGSAGEANSRWVARAAAPLGLLLAIASLFFVPGIFGNLHRHYLLTQNQSVFQDAMQRDQTRITLTNGELAYGKRERGGRYYVSFAGVADNHQGFVFDPSGKVAQAQGWAKDEEGQRFSAPEDVRELFGGDMLGCRPVRSDWFYCTFT